MPHKRLNKLSACLSIAFASTCLSQAAVAEIISYTFTQGASTQFTNGAYVTGTMTINYGLSGNAAVTSANLTVTSPSALSFTQANTAAFGAYSGTVCGSSLAYYEASFQVGGNTLFLDFQKANTTTPVPGTSGVYTSLTYGGPNYALNTNCSAYVPNLLSTTVTSSTQAATNSPTYTVAQVIDAHTNLQNLFVGQSGTAAVTNATNQTLPLLSGSSMAATSPVYNSINRVVQARMEANRGMSSGDEFLGDKNFWMKPFTSWADQADAQGVSGFKARTSGLTLGLDKVVSPQTRLGLAFAYASSSINANSDTAPQASSVDVYQLIGYGSYSLDERTELSFQADAGQNKNKSNRAILFQGTTASAAYDSQSAHVSAGVARTYPVSEGSSLTPSVRLDYTWVEDAGYSESGAGLLNLAVGKRSTDQLIIATDAKLSHALSPNTTLSANAGLGYDTENKRATITAAYAGAPGASFVIQGLQQDPWIVRAGLGLTRTSSTGLEMSVRYDAEGRTGFLNQTASAKLRWAF